MAVHRVEKTNNFTIMDNFFIRDKRISLKAIGLFTKILSLPAEWDYSVCGLTAICKEGKDCIVATLQELERYGYLVRKQIRDSDGRLARVEYEIYERPGLNPRMETPDAETSDTETSFTDKLLAENPSQLKTNKLQNANTF